LSRLLSDRQVPLSSGAQYVIGALWTIPQLATAVLMVRYLESLKDESVDVCAALCGVQREVMMMTKDELSRWFRNLMASGPDWKPCCRKPQA
jgi:CHAT domain-containing protein